MEKISIFKIRIIINEEVFLLASDVKKAFGYKSVNLLRNEYPDVIKQVKGLPLLVSENDFNTILVSDRKVLSKYKHIEMTRVETLRSNTETIKSFYPLKLLVAGEWFKNHASATG